MYHGDAAGLVEIKDVLGIQKTAIMSWVGPVAGDPVDGNDIVNRALQKFPRRFFGVAKLRAINTAARQQAVLQIVRDFCDYSNALCDHCQFPERLKALWRESSNSNCG